MRIIKITENESEQRIDRFLSKYLKKTTRANIYKLLRKKLIKVNGLKAKENQMLQVDDELAIFLSDQVIDEMMETDVSVRKESVALDIVYEDDEILIVNKPAGLLTHPDKSEYKNTLSSKVGIYLSELQTRTFKPASIQRLDKMTSGLVIFCKTYTSLKEYNNLMRERKIQKFYITIVEGEIKESGEVKGYLLKDPERNKVSLSQSERPGSKFVHTKFKPLEYKRGYTLVEVELMTGRAHQIRASLSYIGHPIIGDTKYKGRKMGDITNQILDAYKLKIMEKEVSKAKSEVYDVWNEL